MTCFLTIPICEIYFIKRTLWTFSQDYYVQRHEVYEFSILDINSYLKPTNFLKTFLMSTQKKHTQPPVFKRFIKGKCIIKALYVFNTFFTEKELIECTPNFKWFKLLICNFTLKMSLNCVDAMVSNIENSKDWIF